MKFTKKVVSLSAKSINTMIMATTTSIPKQSQMISPSMCCHINKARKEHEKWCKPYHLTSNLIFW